MLDFKCKVLKRDMNCADYKNALNQYATSSVTNDDSVMNPAFIIYVEDDEDIIKSIKYAKQNDCAIAIRTGGHQYSGTSSTSGKNLQLDLSKTYKTFDISKLQTDSLITCGISLSLEEFSDKLVEHNIFVPHGECKSVYLGGHIQTGGYGVFCNPFGILGDHVESFEIITADCIKKKITKNDNPDLFFAVLGGSPGNFGVMTHVTLRVYKDTDFPESRGLMALYPYRKKHLNNLLNLIEKWNKDTSIPKNIGFKITTRDAYINKFFVQPIKVILIIAINIPGIEGGDSRYDPKYFNDILNTSPSNLSIKGNNFDVCRIPLKHLPSSIKSLYINENTITPLSILGAKSVFKFFGYREYDLPYIKRVYNCTIFDKIDFDKFAEMNTEIGRFFPFTKVDCVSILECGFINENSQTVRNGTNGTGYNFRNFCPMIFDVFYYNKNTAIKYVNEIDKNMKTNKRLFWGSYIKEDESLTQDLFSKVHYDSMEKYNRLLQIKNETDPDKIFSPNEFCIGGMKNKLL